ncbi:MAG: hypothetical protein HC913_06395 [Microscillaceae bacterium]|nr:hypothetical protein [Microscillaceae bacterium]
MRNTTIRWVIALATVSIIGIIITQAYWVRKAFDIKEKQFNQTVFIALKNVAERISKLNASLVNPNPVNQLTSDYFVVNVNDVIDANILEHYLEEEFGRRDLLLDYEYGIYDCSSDKMVYGNYVSHRQLNEKRPSPPICPSMMNLYITSGCAFPINLLIWRGKWTFGSFLLLSYLLLWSFLPIRSGSF